MSRLFIIILGLVLFGLSWEINDPGFLAQMGFPFAPATFLVSIAAIVVGGLGTLLVLGGVAGYLRARAAKLPPPQPVTFAADNFSNEAPPEPAPFPAARRRFVDEPPTAPPPQPFPGSATTPAIVVEPAAEAATEGPRPNP